MMDYILIGAAILNIVMMIAVLGKPSKWEEYQECLENKQNEVIENLVVAIIDNYDELGITDSSKVETRFFKTPQGIINFCEIHVNGEKTFDVHVSSDIVLAINLITGKQSPIYCRHYDYEHEQYIHEINNN